MRAIRVAIAGLGFVGRQTARLLKANQNRIAKTLGAKLELAAVCDRRVQREAAGLGLGKSVLRTRDPRELLKLPGLDIIVELLGGLEAPLQLVLGALKSGRHVVTANKALLAHHWNEIQGLASKNSARVYHEASVAGGIPIISALDKGFAADRIEAVYGILNGTTNYLLTRGEEGLDMDSALREAQNLGLAEKNPKIDLSGQDTAQKISILGALLTGAGLNPSRIARQGIYGLDRSDIDFAKANLGRTPRLLGTLRLNWPKAAGSAGVRIEAHVYPTLVPLNHPLAAVRREYNAVLVHASCAGDLMFYGKGAGPDPAASAVVSDIFTLARDILCAAPVKKRKPAALQLTPSAQYSSPFYLRLLAQDKPGVLAQITAALGRRAVSIASIHQPNAGAAKGRGTLIILTTHPTTQGRFEQALKAILALKAVAPRHTVLRILVC